MPSEATTESRIWFKTKFSMKSVYKVCLLILAMLPVTLGLGAQPKCEKKGKDPEFWKKAQAEKVEFITSRLGLPEAEKEAFLKVYNENEEQKGKLFHERQEALKAMKKALKEEGRADVEPLLKKYIEARARLEEWENSDCERFSKVLSSEQIARLLVAEEDFRREQIHRLDGHRGKGPGMPPSNVRMPRGNEMQTLDR